MEQAHRAGLAGVQRGNHVQPRESREKARPVNLQRPIHEVRDARTVPWARWPLADVREEPMRLFVTHEARTLCGVGLAVRDLEHRV